MIISQIGWNVRNTSYFKMTISGSLLLDQLLLSQSSSPVDTKIFLYTFLLIQCCKKMQLTFKWTPSSGETFSWKIDLPILTCPHSLNICPLDLISFKKSEYILSTSSNVRIFASLLDCFCSGWACMILCNACPTRRLISLDWLSSLQGVEAKI